MTDQQKKYLRLNNAYNTRLAQEPEFWLQKRIIENNKILDRK